MATDNDFRYGGHYQSQLRKAREQHRLRKSLCCCCLQAKTEEWHHSSYRLGRDEPGENWFPVCRKCHTNICHSKENWIVDKTESSNNRNTETFTQRLKLGYLIVTEGKMYT